MNRQPQLDFPDPPSMTTQLAPLPSLRGFGTIAFDTETDLQPAHLGKRKIYGVSWYFDEKHNGYINLHHPFSPCYDEDTVRRWMKGELAGKTLVTASAKHEVHVTKNLGVDLEAIGCRLRDVQFAAALLNENRRKVDLDTLAFEELGRHKEPVDHKTLYLKPADFVAPIAIEDARMTLQLDQLYLRGILTEKLEKVMDLENDLVWSTVEMERNGCHIDVETLTRWHGEVKTELASKLDNLYHATGMALNPDSGKDLQRLFRYCGVENTHIDPKTHNITFDEGALLDYAAGNPEIQTALDARWLSSLLSKYLTKYLRSVQPDCRIFYALHQLRGDEGGTITGRYSSSAPERGEGGGINVQQVTKTKKMPRYLQRWPVRQLFIPPPGERWGSSDAMGIEFRLMAHYAEKHGMPRLGEAFRRDPNMDPHAFVVNITGLSRDDAKNVNYCKIFGGGYKKVAMMCGVSEEKGEEIVEQYDAEFPEPKTLIGKATESAERLGYVVTLYGRRGRFVVDPANLRGSRTYRALNKVLQGSAADNMKLKTRDIYQERKNLGLTMRMVVHDESDVTLPPDPTTAQRWAEFMNEPVLDTTVPLLWETKTGENWDECH